MDVELYDVGAGLERRPHRGQGVFQERMLRRMDARCGAGIALDARGIVGLRQAAMGEQRRPGRALKHQPRGVVEKNERREQPMPAAVYRSVFFMRSPNDQR